ncbi:MAG: RHS repeat-associated core domain-containing protein [Acidobacteriaceae bacterium]|nr:RHS repeat-associated core domain-containing protein [Acidobacteriaceae bacterium]
MNPATNQVNNGAGTGNVASAVYDEAGNQTHRNADSYVYTYDGTAMVTRLTASSRNERYLYDADDQRIAYVNSNASGYRWRYTVRDADGRFVREYTDDIAGTQHTWHWTQDYVYASSRLVGSFLATGTVEARRNFHLDHLGTPRLTTAADGTVLSQQKLLPFGEEAPGSTADKSQTVRFTGHERDYASGSDQNDLDYMHARYYAPKMGRFLSVDPANSASPTRPQSWNRYSYAANDPLNSADPDGRATKPAEAIASGLEHAGAYLKGQGVSLNSGSATGTALDATLGTLGDIVGGAGDMFRAGDAVGEAIDSGATGDELALAIAKDTGRASALLLTMALPARAALNTRLATTATTEVVHFTDDAGRAAITQSGYLRAGTYVTTPGEVEGMTAAQVESRLQIAAGRGANSFTLRVPNSTLGIPPNGATEPVTGAWQRVLTQPCSVDNALISRLPAD